MRAGAARVDITPAPGDMPDRYQRIVDHIYARTLILDNGTERVVLAIVDSPTIGAKVAGDLKQRIAARVEVPERNILLGVTHTHNSIKLVTTEDNTKHSTTTLPVSRVFLDAAVAGILAAVEQALAALQPARLGYAAGRAALIGNRNKWLPEQHRYIEGVDRTGTEPIDQRLGVLTVETVGGQPIAFVLNYGIEPVVAMPMADALSGDVPGATSLYIEDRLGGDVVALFTIGATGKSLYSAGSGADPEALITALATILGEEALAVAAGTPLDDSRVPLVGFERRFDCPGKITKPFNSPEHVDNSPDPTVAPPVFSDQDSAPVTVSMGLLRIGELAVLEVDANVSPAVWLKLAAASPFAKTILVSLTYGPVHYVVSDADYPLNTYEATAAMAKMGHAEQGFLDAGLEMMRQALSGPRE
jgi:neutral ceramidase